MEKIDTIVHVNQELDKPSREGIEEILCKTPGIIDSKFCENRHHLMNVVYDGEVTDGLSILSQVRQSGLTAQLVGF
ncbi:MAG: hypothetical protein HQL69_00835 [Magnetococcales bacterium]|nr:hypothetical protein [Magnetococcales bacterium]